MADLPAGRQARRSQKLVYFIYILKSTKTGEFYKGIASDLEQRLKRHFSGSGYFPKWKLPLKLIHVEMCETRPEARKLEKFFKSGYGREIIKEIAHKI